MVHTPANELFNKEFGTVRFTEGYDMDEVDDYLDNELIPCMKELMAENSQLKKELEEARGRIAELESGAAPVSAEAKREEVVVDDEPTVVAPVSEAATGETPVVSVVEEDEEVAEVEAPAETADEKTSASFAAATPAPAAADQSAAGIIALAQRLHDEHVQKGEVEYSRLVGEAEERSRQIVGEAEEKSRTTLQALESEKAGLEKTIEQLRTFERDYRNRLRTYLENQMRELETSGTQEQHANFGL
ncbi:DivIVA domain-containing protein [Dermabacteraceae bacterium TAE3-ERU27]|nr:DivIVA domain-containing protein [Dermabacteraceae bacterium TAE3-ERU27]